MRVLVVSNGKAEDTIGASLIRALKERVSGGFSAFPLVGMGHAYRDVADEVLGLRRELPSGGFVFASPANFLADLKAGVVGFYARQKKALEELKGMFDLVISVGDTFCASNASLVGGLRFHLLTSLSRRMRPFLPVEVRELKNIAGVFPRDSFTHVYLKSKGVTSFYLGDVVSASVGKPSFLLKESEVVGVLPGSRVPWVYRAFKSLLRVMERAHELRRTLVFAVAWVPHVSLEPVFGHLGERGFSTRGLKVGFLSEKGGMKIYHLIGMFSEVVFSSGAILSCAGGAAEQASALGRPVVTYPAPGAQTTRTFLLFQLRFWLSSGSKIFLTCDAEKIARYTVNLFETGQAAQKGLSSDHRAPLEKTADKIVELSKSLLSS